MTEDESDVFEITDFTTASEWERFIAKLEEVIHEWRLSSSTFLHRLKQDELSTGKWEEESDVLDFAGFKFTITRHRLVNASLASEATTYATEPETASAQKDDKVEDVETEETPLVWQDMMSIAHDFPGRAHCLCRYYGLRDFVTVIPAPEMDDIMTEGRANILMSSVAIAINNTACKVPIFVQVHSKWRKMYSGHFEVPGFRTTFEMVHLKHAPKQYRHLSGLLDVFKSKIASPAPDIPPVSVAVRFTYVLQEWPLYEWSQAPPDIDSYSGAEIGVGEFGILPFGACTDPVGDLQLSVTWPTLSEEMIVDGDVYSDLNALQAPHWSVKVRMVEDPQCLLGDYLDEFVELCKNIKSTDQLLGRLMENAQTEIDVTSALDRLTDPSYNIPTLGNVVSRTTTVVTRATTRLQIRSEDAPIPTALLDEILIFLFPDAKNDFIKKNSDLQIKSSTSSEQLDGPPVTESTCFENSCSESKQDLGELQEVFRQFKSAPVESLTYKLAVVMAVINHSYGGIRAVAHLWQEFVLEMRYRWENNYVIHELEPGSPNMGCSLLHQKLQMLNCCIERKKARESAPDVELEDDPDTISPCSDQLVDSRNEHGINSESNQPSEAQDSYDRSDLQDSLRNKNAAEREIESHNAKRDSDKFSRLEPENFDLKKHEQCSEMETESFETNEKDRITDDKNSNSSSLSSEDEFFECEDDDEDGMDISSSSMEDSKTVSKPSRSSTKSSKKKTATRSKTDSGLGKEEPMEQGDLRVDSTQSEGSLPTSSQPTFIAEIDQSDSKDIKTDNHCQSSIDVSQSEIIIEKEASQPEMRSRNSSQSEAKESISRDSDVSFMDVYGYMPEGRLKPCGDLKLLSNNLENVYVPVTQDPAPMTEDTLDEHAEVLAKLGTSEEGMHLRARMQSASLCSDMESFKAANPGASLGDFVRWYSPRDWIDVEEEGPDGSVITKGQLSQRMQIPGNMWVEVWLSAKPIPARRQKRLFDDTKEAEKVLHWLASLKPSDVAVRLMPMLVHASVSKLHEPEESSMPIVRKLLKQIADKASKVMRAPRLDMKTFEDLTRLLGLAEVYITRAQSLQQKLCHEKQDVTISNKDVKQFVSDLLEQPEVKVISAGYGPIGKIIHNLFKAAQKSSHMVADEDTEQENVENLDARRFSTSVVPDFPTPAGKEYILRTFVQRPAPWSRPSPQRMYSIVIKNEFRLLGAFSSDTTFQ